MPGFTAQSMASRNPPRHRQDGVLIRVEVGMKYRIPVYRGVVVGWHVHGGDHITGQNPSRRHGQRDVLGFRHGACHRSNQRQRLCRRHQTVAMRKTIVGQLGHGSFNSACPRSPCSFFRAAIRHDVKYIFGKFTVF